MAQVTRLGLYGGARAPYGSFAGREDVTAPVLSDPTGTATGATTATGTVSTDEGNGTLYYWATTSASETAAAIQASGESQTVSATGTQNVSVTGLTGSSTYYLHYVQLDAATNESNVASSAAFTTTSAHVNAPSNRTLIVRHEDRAAKIAAQHRSTVIKHDTRQAAA